MRVKLSATAEFWEALMIKASKNGDGCEGIDQNSEV